MTTRIRYLKPDFFLDEDVADLDPLVRLFYAGLWTHADRAGRLEDRPERLKVEILPYDEFDAEGALVQLAKQKRVSDRPFILRYEVDGRRYIQILSWDKHQRPHPSEKQSQIPVPPLDNMALTCKKHVSTRCKTLGIETGIETGMGMEKGRKRRVREERRTTGTSEAKEKEKSGDRLPPFVGRSAPPSEGDKERKSQVQRIVSKVGHCLDDKRKASNRLSGGTGEAAFLKMQSELLSRNSPPNPGSEKQTRGAKDVDDVEEK